MPDTIEGKTKIVESMGGTYARIHSKDDITAGDGKRHEIMQGKAANSNRITQDVFVFLRRLGIPVAYVNGDSETSFLSLLCDQQPWEVVLRRRSRGSMFKRHPEFPDGYRFEEPRVEFYLKTSGRVWRSVSRDKVYAELKCDDPLAIIKGNVVSLYEASAQFAPGGFFVRIDACDVFKKEEDQALMEEMKDIALRSFLLLEQAFEELGAELDDLKVEFGVAANGKLYLSDVIDCDSWRLRYRGVNLDKQGFREGEPIEDTLRRYQIAAKLTRKFSGLSADVLV